MSRTFASGSQQALRGSQGVTVAPLTLACFYYPTTSNSGILLGQYNSGAVNTHYFDLQSRGDGTVRGRHNDGDILNTSTTATAGLNAWHHAAYVVASNSSHAIYLDGGNVVSDTSSTQGDPSGINRTAIGEFSPSSPSTWFTGRIAEAAVWDAALSAAEIAMLGDFVSPLFVRPQNLVAYWPLFGVYSPEVDRVGGLNLTLVNTPGVADHPRVWYPDSGILGIPQAAAPAGGLAKIIGARARLVGHGGGLVG